MNRVLSRLGRTATMLALSSLPILAQGSTDSPFSFKFRAQAGTQDKVGVRNGLGFGVNYDFKVGPGALGVELGYQYWSGDQFKDVVPANAFGATDMNSVNSKKASVQGIMARAMYRWALPDTDWAFQGGVAFGNLRSNIESVANYTDGVNQHGSWAISTSHSDFSANPFLGATYSLSPSGSLEMNVLYANYKQTDVDSVAGATAFTPSVISKSEGSLKLEVAYVFHF